MNDLNKLQKLAAIARMNNATARIAFETAVANSEEAKGHWLSDHTAAVDFWQKEFDAANTHFQSL